MAGAGAHSRTRREVHEEVSNEGSKCGLRVVRRMMPRRTASTALIKFVGMNVARAGLPVLVPSRGSVSCGHTAVTAPMITFCSPAHRCKASCSVRSQALLLDFLVQAAPRDAGARELR